MQFENCSLKEFLDKKYEKVICFGGGNYFRAFCEECSSLGGESPVIAVADNFINQRNIVHDDVRIPVIRAEEITEYMDENTVLVVTTAYHWEVTAQLEKIRGLERLPYYVYPVMQIFASGTDCTRVIMEKEPLIPKIIHYCWFGGGSMTEEEIRYIDGWKNICPDYEIRRWDESNYDVSVSLYASQAYQDRKWAFVSDYARADILYRYGGFYFDTDVEMLKSIEPLRRHQGFIGMEAAGGVASGLGCGFRKGHPFLKELMGIYESTSWLNKEGTQKLKVNANFETDILRKYGFKKYNDFQLINGVAVYPPEYFSPLIVGTNISHITENTYSIHHYHYSWRSEIT